MSDGMMKVTKTAGELIDGFVSLEILSALPLRPMLTLKVRRLKKAWRKAAMDKAEEHDALIEEYADIKSPNGAAVVTNEAPKYAEWKKKSDELKAEEMELEATVVVLPDDPDSKLPSFIYDALDPFVTVEGA